MGFTSLVFLSVFLPVLLAVYYALPARGQRARSALLLAAGLLFYAFGEPVFLPVLAALAALNWLAARAASGGRRVWLYAACAADLALLAACRVLGFSPAGISFFVFRMLSYAADVLRGSCAAGSLSELFGYAFFFPALVSGPIDRFGAFAPQLARRGDGLAACAEGVRRFIIGLGKKALLAEGLRPLGDLAFSAAPPSLPLAWLGAAAYALQLLFDFSGYSDMAVGLAGMFGFRMPENFRFPYAARSLGDFWRRWHITLGAWFRDYVYIPLGGSRAGTARMLLALLAVWLGTGLWHGSGLTFLAWGLWNFLLVAGGKLLGFEAYAKRAKGAGLVLCRALTLLGVLLGWVLFRSGSLPDALCYLRAMFAGVPALSAEAAESALGRLPLLLAGTALCFPASEKLLLPAERPAMRLLQTAALLAVLLLSACALVNSAYNPFIYAAF